MHTLWQRLFAGTLIFISAQALAGPSIVIESGIDDESVPYSDLSFELVLGGAGSFDPSFNSDPFSINIGGTFYETVFINPNGILTFGESYGGTAPTLPSLGTTIADIGIPAIAPLFVGMSDVTSIQWGTGNTFGGPTTWIGYRNATGDAGGSADFQVGIQSRGSGDFDIIFNYGTVTIPDAVAGITDGINAFAFAGAGSYVGDDSALCAAPSLACYNTNVPAGELHPDTGLLVRGRHILQFRDGAPVSADVPEPSTFGLLLVTLGGTIVMRRRKQHAGLHH